MTTDTEAKWFSFFMVGLTPLALHAHALGRTGIVMLYAAGDFFLRTLAERSNLSSDEIAQAKTVSDEAVMAAHSQKKGTEA